MTQNILSSKMISFAKSNEKVPVSINKIKLPVDNNSTLPVSNVIFATSRRNTADNIFPTTFLIVRS